MDCLGTLLFKNSYMPDKYFKLFVLVFRLTAIIKAFNCGCASLNGLSFQFLQSNILGVRLDENGHG